MNGQDFSKQLSYLPDDMVEEALKKTTISPTFKLQYKRYAARSLRIAACLAVVIGLLLASPGLHPGSEGIVAGPGLLTVRVYAEDSGDPSEFVEYLLEEGVEVPDRAFIAMTNSYIGVPTNLSVETVDFPAEKISYQVSASAGVFANNDLHGYTQDWFSTLTCENFSTFRWNLVNGAGADWYDEKYDCSFVKIVIYCENHIVGYAVIRYDRLYTDEWAKLNPEMEKHYAHLDAPIPVDIYYCTLIKSVSFPKIDGEYQNVTKKYVTTCLDNIINAQ